LTVGLWWGMWSSRREASLKAQEGIISMSRERRKAILQTRCLCCEWWQAALCPIPTVLEGIVVIQWILTKKSSPFIPAGLWSLLAVLCSTVPGQHRGVWDFFLIWGDSGHRHTYHIRSHGLETQGPAGKWYWGIEVINPLSNALINILHAHQLK
jgi:hypothetical protein